MRRSAVLALGLALLIGCTSAAPSFRGTVLDPPREVQDFSLTDQNGRTFRLSDQRGQFSLAYLTVQPGPRAASPTGHPLRWMPLAP